MTIDAVLTGAATLTGAGAGRRDFGLGRGLGLGATTTGTLSVAGDSAERAQATDFDGALHVDSSWSPTGLVAGGVEAALRGAVR